MQFFLLPHLSIHLPVWFSGKTQGVNLTIVSLVLALLSTANYSQAQNTRPNRPITTNKKLLKKIQEINVVRDKIKALDFVNLYAAPALKKAETNYRSLLVQAEKGQTAAANRGFEALKADYNKIVRTSVKNSGIVSHENYLNQRKADAQKDIRMLRQVRNGGTGPVLEQYDNFVARVNLDNFIQTTWTGDGEPPVYYGGDPKTGPRLPHILGATRDTNSLVFRWEDRANDEQGFKLYRSDNCSGDNFRLMREYGAATGESETLEFVDNTVFSGQCYGYKVEVFNAEGSSTTFTFFEYTLDSTALPIFRIQLEISVANKEDAGSDPSFIYGNVGNNTLTYLDYAHDDFERNSTFQYDLNTGDIDESWDIRDITLVKEGGSDLVLSKIALLLNNQRVFEKSFPAGYPMAGENSLLFISLQEIRNQDAWQNFLNISSLELFAPNLDNTNLPVITPAEEPGYSHIDLSLKLPAAEIRSRVESLLGHISAEQRREGKPIDGWGDTPNFEMKKKTNSSLNFKIKFSSNPEGVMPEFDLNLDFDVTFAITCEENSLIFQMQPSTPKFNSDFPDWKDVVSFGCLKAIDICMDRLMNSCDCGMTVTEPQEFRIDNLRNLDCQNLELFVTDTGDLLVRHVEFDYENLN